MGLSIVPTLSQGKGRFSRFLKVGGWSCFYPMALLLLLGRGIGASVWWMKEGRCHPSNPLMQYPHHQREKFTALNALAKFLY